MNAIEVSGLTKRYDAVTAVDDLTLAVESGELFGLLGPNGAGKTTLVNTLCTLVSPTAGTASVAGHDIRTEPARVRENIGVVFQEPALDEELTGEENLVFHARLYGITGARRRERIDEVLDLVDLDDRRDEKVGDYSGGMARRLELARGLLHEPAVLFLDEPTVGLDAGTRKDVREYIEALNARTGVTVVLTTHYMEEADALCDRVAIVDRGNVVACDTPAALKRTLGGDAVAVRVSDPDAVTARLREFAWVGSVDPTDDGVSVVVDDGERRVPELVVAASEVADVTGVSVEAPTLERVFLDLTGRSVTDAEGEPVAATATGGD
ncbi:ABC transporter ATP-binding protein [Halorarius litoreus]|uniref:ABC transporter ATP-binding protein n=1 Tax=Halorarius litoreus TaxID=2962676 RepID=UPI0020CBC5A3|nr:ATP-binding cassette domain-containing protein [Halorarius litoreus]